MTWFGDIITGLIGPAADAAPDVSETPDAAFAGTLLNASGDRPYTPLPAVTPNSSTWGDFFWGLPGLPQVTEHTAQQISAVYSCVNLIAGAISALPLGVNRRKSDGERTALPNDDLWWLLNEEFLPRWGAPNGWEFLILNLLFHGNGYAIIRRHPITSAPIGLEPVHRYRVTAIPTPDRRRLVYTVAHDMRVPNSAPGYEVYDQDDMIDIAGFGFDGWYGLSPLKYHLLMAGGVALATQEYAARFFTNGARPDMVVTSDQSISEETAKRIQDNMAARYGGLQNSHKPMVLGNGATVTPVSLSAEDAQLLSTRRFQVEEICRIYGVPPFMVGHMDKTTSWGSGVETMGQGFVRFTLRQHLSKIEHEINRKFFQTKGKFVEFDTHALERANMQTLFASFATALGSGGGRPFMTTDEVRRMLNLPRTDGGAQLQEPTNAPQPTTQPAGE